MREIPQTPDSISNAPELNGPSSAPSLSATESSDTSTTQSSDSSQKDQGFPRETLPWAEVAMRIVVWLLLGTAINLLPLLIAYVTGAGEQVSGGGESLTVLLSSGDLLIATTAMLPPTLADLAINASKARRTRIVIVTLGGLVSLISLLLYGFAFANDLSRQYNQPVVARHLSQNFVAVASVVFFLIAAVLGALCAAFLAVKSNDSTSTGKPRTNG